MERTAQHLAPITIDSIAKDLHDGIMEGFGYWSRNGRHRAEYVEPNMTPYNPREEQ